MTVRDYIGLTLIALAVVAAAMGLAALLEAMR